MILKAGGYYIPLYNVRELYFGHTDVDTLYVSRNTELSGGQDVEPYKLTAIEATHVRRKLSNL